MSPGPSPKQERVIVFIDGSNLYHSLKSLKIYNLLNFNYGKFVAWLAGKRKVVVKTYTDLLPAIDKVVELKKKVEYVGFGHRPSFALQKHATVSRLLVKNDLLPFTSK